MVVTQDLREHSASTLAQIGQEVNPPDTDDILALHRTVTHSPSSAFMLTTGVLLSQLAFACLLQRVRPPFYTEKVTLSSSNLLLRLVIFFIYNWGALRKVGRLGQKESPSGYTDRTGLHSP